MATNADDTEDTEGLENAFQDMLDMEIEGPDKRKTCEKCRRPLMGCYCSYITNPPVDPQSTIYILQHPHEEKRCLRTAPMLCHGLQPDKCHVLKGKRFHPERHTQLKSVYEASNTVLLYPGPDAQDVEEVVKERGPGEYNIILIDGTWAQARGIFLQNKCLHKIKKVSLQNTGVSEYVIRTQPTDGSLSTLESAALALSVLEGKPDIKEKLTKPLKALCQFQLDHGAVVHHSKQYLIDNGLYVKQGTNGHCRQKHIQKLINERKEQNEPEEQSRGDTKE